VSRIADLADAPEWLRAAHVSAEDVEIIDGRVVWLGGVWRVGTWHDGVWHDGVWLGGVWHGGVWHDGTWRDGTWLGGVWLGGTVAVPEPRAYIPPEIARAAAELIDDEHWIRGADTDGDCHCLAGAIIAAGGNHSMCRNVRTWNDTPTRTAAECRAWLARHTEWAQP
jgi:hypothetical protein